VKSIYPRAEPDALRVLRRILLAVYLIGALGLAAELFLLEHVDGVWQWVPLVLLGAGFFVGVAVALRPGRASLLAFRALMAAFVAAGAVGAYLHLRGNMEFELESDPALRGAALLWEALKGATPALAPGALAQLGLVGLALAYRHPALNPSNTGNR
jgi:hypothetical protein